MENKGLEFLPSRWSPLHYAAWNSDVDTARSAADFKPTPCTPKQTQKILAS